MVCLEDDSGKAGQLEFDWILVHSAYQTKTELDSKETDYWRFLSRKTTKFPVSCSGKTNLTKM